MTCKHGIYPNPEGDPSVFGCWYCEQEERDRRSEREAKWGPMILIAIFLILSLLAAANNHDAPIDDGFDHGPGPCAITGCD
jgi:hypothetical protein